MDSKPYAASIRMDSGLVSFQIPEDHSDNESDFGDNQRRDEIREEMEDLMLGLVNGDHDDSSSHSHDDGANFTTSELTFNREINEKNARLKNATSTPFASTHRRLDGLQPHTQPDSPMLMDRRGKGDFRADFLQNNDRRTLFPAGKLDMVPEVDTTDFRSSAEVRPPGKENSYGLKQTQSASLSPTYGRLKEVEKISSQAQPYGGLAGRTTGTGGRGDFRSPTVDNDLLAQDSLNPTPTKTQFNKILEEKDRALKEETRKKSQMEYEYTSKQNALEEEVHACGKRMQELNQENQMLRDEADRDQLEINSLNEQVVQLRNLLKENRVDLDAMKEEKQDLLRKVYITEGANAQLKKSIEDMTPWETVENLKTQNETMILRMKDIQQAEMRQIQENHSKDIRRMEEQLTQARTDLETTREKLRASEASKNALHDKLATAQVELTSKTALTSDHRQEQKARELLQLHLKNKTEEVDRLTKRVAELEDRLNSQHTAYSDESSRLHEELSTTVKANIQLLDEQSKAVQDNMKTRDELSQVMEENASLTAERSKLTDDLTKSAFSDRNKTAEVQALKLETAELKKKIDGFDKLRQENVDLKAEIGGLEKTTTDLRDKVASLEKELMTKNTAPPVASRHQSSEQVRRQTEEQMAEAKKKFHDMTDNLHSQLKNAATENHQLRDDKTKLLAEVHLMKKVLKKLKKHITGNPSPSGDSGISTENKNETSQSTPAAHQPPTTTAGAGGDEALADRSYVRELITMKAELRLEMERKYQQQLEIDREKIIGQIDVLYTHKLQQVLTRLGIEINPGTGSQPAGSLRESFH